MAFNSLTVIGYWNAATNTPKLVSGKGETGKGYIVTVPGGTSLDGYSSWEIDDIVVFGLDKWVRLSSQPARAPVDRISFRGLGGIPDGITNNAPALIAAGEEARAVCSLYPDAWAQLTIEPGVYKYKFFTGGGVTGAFQWSQGIKRLKITAHGATLRSDYYAWDLSIDGNAADSIYRREGSRIATTARGNRFVTLTEPTSPPAMVDTYPGTGFRPPYDFDAFLIGDYLQIASQCVQPASYPINPYYHEKAKVATKLHPDATTPTTKINVFTKHNNTPSSYTVDFTITGLNGLDTGALAASTTYHVLLISNGTTTGAIASLQITPTGTLPIGYSVIEYAGQVESNGSSTLVQEYRLFLDRPLKYVHRSDYPDIYAIDPALDACVPCGAARVWRLDEFHPFDTVHIVEGIKLDAVDPARASTLDYAFQQTRQSIWRDCDISGFAPQFNELLLMDNCLVRSIGEVDKTTEIAVLRNCTILRGFNFINPVELAIMENCTFYNDITTSQFYALQAGGAKRVVARNSYIEGLYFYSQLGYAESWRFEQCEIKFSLVEWRPYLTDIPLRFGTDPEGAVISYADGVITISNFQVSEATFQNFNWSCIRGMYLNLSGPSNIYTGPSGDGLIVDTKDGGTLTAPTFEIHTTLPYATLPAWVSGFRLMRHGVIDFIRCTGSPEVEMASEACAAGKHPAGYLRFRHVGSGQPTDVTKSVIGVVTEVIIDNRRVRAGQTLFIDMASYSSADFSSFGNTRITIDLGETGRRKFTLLDGHSTLKGSDALSVTNFAGGSTAGPNLSELHWAPSVHLTASTGTNVDYDVRITADPGNYLSPKVEGY